MSCIGDYQLNKGKTFGKEIRLMKSTIRNNLSKIIIAVIIIVILAIFSSPIRAIKIGAFIYGCEWNDVKNAKFRVSENVNLITTEYVATNTELTDKTTETGHSTWIVYNLIIIKIPYWPGNG